MLTLIMSKQESTETINYFECNSWRNRVWLVIIGHYYLTILYLLYGVTDSKKPSQLFLGKISDVIQVKIQKFIDNLMIIYMWVCMFLFKICI